MHIGNFGHDRRNRRERKQIKKVQPKKERLEEIKLTQPKEISKNRLTQEDIATYSELELEPCPYIRNPTVDRKFDRSDDRLYGLCALSQQPCSNHTLQPIGSSTCEAYNRFWNSRPENVEMIRALYGSS